MICVRVNGKEYPAIITGKLNDKEWDGRNSKAIKLKISASEAYELFKQNTAWTIVEKNEVEVDKINEETGDIEGTELIVETEEYDNSEYSIAGDVIDHRNGYVTVKMGKPTAEELLETKIQESNELWTEMTAAYDLGVQEA